MNQSEYNELYLEIIQDLLDDPYSELTQRRAREVIETSNIESDKPETFGKWCARKEQELLIKENEKYRKLLNMYGLKFVVNN